MVNVNRCLAPRREWKNIRSVKYYKLLLRDLNALALGSIVDFKCDDNETTMTMANTHKKRSR